jgi:hypothetical protein
MPPIPNSSDHRPPGVLPLPGVDRDRALERSGYRVEGVDLAVDEAEIADQQVAAKWAKAGRGKSDAPGCRELAANDALLARTTFSRRGALEGLDPPGNSNLIDAERLACQLASQNGRERSCALAATTRSPAPGM